MTLWRAEYTLFARANPYYPTTGLRSYFSTIFAAHLRVYTRTTGCKRSFRYRCDFITVYLHRRDPAMNIDMHSTLCVYTVWLQMHLCLNRNVQEASACVFSLLELQVFPNYSQGFAGMIHSWVPCMYINPLCCLKLVAICSWIFN